MWRPTLAGFAVAAALTAASAAAQGSSYDFCVACTEPQAIYLCTVVPHEPDPGPRAWSAFCTERARAAGHANCSAQAHSESCQATRALVFRGPRASESQAEALLSGEPERRRSAAEEIWARTVENLEAVGEGVAESTEAVTSGAREAGGRLWDGMVEVGRGMARGAGCIVTFGLRC